eukprot:PITA_12053
MDEVYGKDDQVIEAAQVDILQLKDSNILKGIIPLEDVFDHDDLARKPTLLLIEKDLKEYDKKIIQHTIPVKLDQNPFRQKLRRINPRLLPSIEKEVNKLYKVGIIVPIRFSNWISNLVLVRKMTQEIRICIDFRNLNKESLKDNYPLPKMDHIL